MRSAVDKLSAALRENFHGDLLRPADSGYAEARVIWNAMVGRSPALIARCADLADVQAVVRATAAAGCNPAVRCGGHSLAGFSTCENGVVIDLKRLRSGFVDGT